MNLKCLFGFHRKPTVLVYDRYEINEKKNKPAERFSRAREFCGRCGLVLNEAHSQMGKKQVPRDFFAWRKSSNA